MYSTGGSYQCYHFFKLFTESTVAPTEEPAETEGPKAWVIAVAVVVSLGIVGLGLAGIIWWKWRSRALGMGYTKQQDEGTTVDQR